MKSARKILSLGLAACLIVMLFCSSSVSAFAEWDTSVPTEVTGEIQALFDEAVQGLLGVNYTPVAVLGQQENAWCILCKATVVYPGAKPYYALVSISGSEGSAAVQNITVLKLDDGAEIDYGTSELFTVEEMDAAIDVIMAEFNTWEGCEMHSIRYASDECCTAENIAWLNEHGDGHEYTQCIEFLSDFHSPVEGGGAWNADEEYTNWNWWLGRTDGGEWELVDWGY